MLPRTVVCIRRLCTGRSTERWYRAPFERMGRWIQAKYPSAYKVQRTVVDSGKQCFADIKTYYRVSSEMKGGRKLEQFTRQELEVYILTPGDIEKLLAIAFVIALPMTIFIMAIALAFFPRLLLTRHFWTLEQTEKFRSVILQKRRQFHYAKIAQYLANEMDKKAGDKNALAVEFAQAIQRPPVSLNQLKNYLDVVRLVDLESLPPRYQFHLSRAHGLWTWGKSAPRLRLHAQILSMLDSKLRNEGVDSMSLKDMKQSLYIRQYDIVELSDEEERQLLKDWLSLTQRDTSPPIVLHAPIISQLHLAKKP